MKTIPIIVLAGSLGCGKTTLLNHILASSTARIGVIINDFGAINIDALLIEGQVDSAQTITGGCLCCIADPSELDDALEFLTQPNLDLDAIVIESSGLAEPRDLARMVLSSEQPKATFGGIMVMLDCQAWLAADCAAASLTNSDQFNVASLLVANKADALTEEQQNTLRNQLKTITPKTPVVFTTSGNLAPQLLFDTPDRPPTIGQLSLVDLVRTHHHHHSHHDSLAWNDPRGCDPTKIVALLEDLPADVVRAKGVFWCPGESSKRQFVAHSVAGIITIESKPRPKGQKAETNMVFIGAHLDKTVLDAAMDQCHTDTPVNEQTVANLSRFAPPTATTKPAATQPMSSDFGWLSNDTPSATTDTSMDATSPGGPTDELATTGTVDPGVKKPTSPFGPGGPFGPGQQLDPDQQFGSGGIESRGDVDYEELPDGWDDV